MTDQRRYEEIVLDAMRNVLEDPTLGADSDFFAAGGNSLLAAELVDRIEACVGGRLRIRAVLRNSTARRLAQALAEERQASASGR